MSFKNKKKQKFRHLGAFEKLDKIEEARFLIEAERWHEAMEFLRETIKSYPTEVRFWQLLAAAASQISDTLTMQEAFGTLKRLTPADTEASLGLAFAYALDDRTALSYRQLQDFLQNSPANEKSDEAARMMDQQEIALLELLARFGFPDGGEGLALACLHEEAQVLLNQRKFEEAKAKASALIERRPEFTPAYNNLSLILFMNGEAERAAETARLVIEKDPVNFHALSNLVRFYVFLGEQEQAREFAERLRTVTGDAPDLWIKKVEAFTFAGDDEAVVEVYRRASRDRKNFEPDSYGKHLAAFGYYQLGKERQARKIWEEILDEDPDFDFALDNLEELELPANERSVFALPARYWIPERYVEELSKETSQIKYGRRFEKNLQKKLAGYFERHPNILHVLSLLLERGDEFAQNFALTFLRGAATAESFAVLKNFALGQKGSDEMRYRAAMALNEAGQLPGKVKLWHDGEWREMMLMTFEITGEPTDIYPMKPKAQQLLRRGLEAMHRKNLDLADDYFHKALEANGVDHPSLLYNILTIRQMKTDRLKADKDLAEIVRRFPDYSFAAISLAISKVRKDEIEAARHLTERFYEKKKWHVSEIKMWFYFNLELALAENHFDSARRSLEMLRNFDENLDEKYWSDLIDQMEFYHKISSIQRRPRRSKAKKKD